MDQLSSRSRRNRRPAGQQRGARGGSEGRILLWGLHTVAAALANPLRPKHRLRVTLNARERLLALGAPLPSLVEIVSPRDIAASAPPDAVHQGALLETEPLPAQGVEALSQARLVLALDQVTDPHNVGAIMRSAVALGADAVVTTARHSPAETGVLAKAASGALDLIPHVVVGSLAKALDELGRAGFSRIGLDSAGASTLEAVAPGARSVLVLGAEGKGLRAGIRAACGHVARLDMTGPIKSLNVSNAAAIALYVVRRRLDPIETGD